MEIVTITPIRAEEKRAKGEGLHFVDVRSPAEYEAVHATGAKLYPLDTLDPKRVATELGISAQAPVVLLCAGGNRARKAAEKFHAEGIPHCLVVEGGTKAWEAAGLPVVLCNARAMGEFGAVSVVSGVIRNKTVTIPLQLS